MGTAVAKREPVFLGTRINNAHRTAWKHSAKSEEARRKALECAADYGRLLTEAKGTVPHGTWLDWLKDNTEVQPRQAQKYMCVAERWGDIQAWLEANPNTPSNSYLSIDGTLRLLRKPKPVVEVIEAGDDDDEPNTGCNYDPADPRGFYKDEGAKVVRRRAWLNMAASAVEMAYSFTAESGHRAIAVADAVEVDAEVSTAAWDAYQAWGRVHRMLSEKRASTLPQDGRSEVPVDDPTPEIGDIPACLDRRRPKKSAELFGKLEAELRKTK